MQRRSARLGETRFCGWRWSEDQLGEPSEVLRDSGEHELELGAAWPTQSQTAEAQNAL